MVAYFNKVTKPFSSKKKASRYNGMPCMIFTKAY